MTSATSPKSGNTVTTLNPNNPFKFWFYFTVAVSLVTLSSVVVSSLYHDNSQTWFLTLPDHVRQHYADGRMLKVQTSPNHNPIEVFVLDKSADNLISFENTVLIVHGLGLSSYDFREVVRKLVEYGGGLRVVVVDLPGSGFSEKCRLEVEREVSGVFGKMWSIYSLIREKGVFWAFDQMVDTGEIPYEEIERLVMRRKSVEVVELGSEEIGRVLSQVVSLLRLSSVHLVLHDSALGMCANWAVENAEGIKTVTLVDTSMSTAPALPLWVFKVPIVREFILQNSYVYGKLVNKCCSRTIDTLKMDAHRMFLNSRDGREAVVGMGNKLNHSFDLAQWGGVVELKKLPLQVLWSGSWSEEWRNQGRHVANALPHARFVKHSGARWPQDKAAADIAEGITSFIFSFSKVIEEVLQEPIPVNFQKKIDKSEDLQPGHRHDEL